MAPRLTVGDAEELERLRRLHLPTIASHAGFVPDRGKSTRRDHVLRRGAEVVVCSLDPRDGTWRWFAAAGGGRGGGVVQFWQCCVGGSLGAVRRDLRRLAGLASPGPPHSPTAVPRPATAGPAQVAVHWRAMRHGPSPYLASRGIPIRVQLLYASELRLAGTACAAAHRDTEGRVVGYELRGSGVRSFARGGQRRLAQFGCREAQRLVVTESAIDALSVAALEGCRRDTRYASTAGRPSAAAIAALQAACAEGRIGEVDLAFDADAEGAVMGAAVASALAGRARIVTLPPTGRAKDWNDVLRCRSH